LIFKGGMEADGFAGSSNVGVLRTVLLLLGSSCCKQFADTSRRIMFMREFRIITSDPKSKIKTDDLEALGEPFAPEYFYETIRKLKRFSHMRV
jgi:hypothetical protein